MKDERSECKPDRAQPVINVRERGFTLIELIITVFIISILVGVAVPLAKNSIQRQKEVELREALRELRTAIDKYKDASDRGFIQMKVDTEGYPEKLDVLVDGVDLVGTVGKKLKLLRRIPRDPMTNSTEWGMQIGRASCRERVEEWEGG